MSQNNTNSNEDNEGVTTNSSITQVISNNESLKFLYTNADQFVNKRNDLCMLITGDEPDIMLITEVIPKNQVNPITNALLDIDGYDCWPNFDPDMGNLGASGIRVVAIYAKKTLKAEEVKFEIDGFQDHAWLEIQVGNNRTTLICAIYKRSTK